MLMLFTTNWRSVAHCVTNPLLVNKILLCIWNHMNLITHKMCPKKHGCNSMMHFMFGKKGGFQLEKTKLPMFHEINGTYCYPHMLCIYSHGNIFTIIPLLMQCIPSSEYEYSKIRVNCPNFCQCWGECQHNSWFTSLRILAIG